MAATTLKEWNEKIVALAKRMDLKEKQIQRHVDATGDTELAKPAVQPLIHEKYEMTVEAGDLEREYQAMMAARK